MQHVGVLGELGSINNYIKNTTQAQFSSSSVLVVKHVYSLVTKPGTGWSVTIITPQRDRNQHANCSSRHVSLLISCVLIIA